MNRILFGKNEFCGPSVLSAICGISTDEAAAVLSSITGRNKVAGIYIRELKSAFNQLGYNCVDVLLARGTSLSASPVPLHGKDGQYIFTIPGHFIAIELNGNHKYICDNHTKEPINVGASARLSMRVQHVFKVVKR